MTGKYIDNSKEIYCLISEDNIQLLSEKYPDVIKYLNFIKYMIDIYFEDGAHEDDLDWFINHDLKGCLKACEDIEDKMDLLFSEKELVLYIMDNFDLNYWLLLIFKPEYYVKKDNISRAVDTVNDILMYDYYYLKVNDERIRIFFNHINDIKRNHTDLVSDFPLNLVLFYCYINNNYENLYKLISNYNFYYDYIMSNYAQATVEILYKDLDSIFNKPTRLIK